MKFEFVLILNYSILLVGIIGIIRFPEIGKSYYPFIFLVWIGCLNEMISHWLLTHGHYNIININIYMLLEALLLLQFLKNISVQKGFKIVYHILFLLFCLSWVFESFILNSFGAAFNSYFTVIYSFLIVILSINTINNILIREKHVLRNSKFLILIGIIIFFTYRIITEIFTFYGIESSANFLTKVYAIMVWINMLTNLIYALAILWMQKKQVFTLPY